jgi:hypothetical protein
VHQGPEGWKSLSAAQAVSPDSPAPADTADLDIRMSPIHFLLVYLGSGGVALLGAVALARQSNTGLRAFLEVGIPIFILVTIYAFRIRVRVKGDEVTHFGWAKTLKFPAHTADRAFKYSFDQLRGSQFRLFVVRDRSGHCALSRCSGWSGRIPTSTG